MRVPQTEDHEQPPSSFPVTQQFLGEESVALLPWDPR